MVDRIHDRIAACWRMMDEQITPGRYILGDEMTALDIYVTVISRFGPWRNRFYKTAPKLSEIPSSGCRRMTSRLAGNCDTSVLRNNVNGARLN